MKQKGKESIRKLEKGIKKNTKVKTSIDMRKEEEMRRR